MSARCGCFLPVSDLSDGFHRSEACRDGRTRSSGPWDSDIATIWDLVELGAKDVPDVNACRFRSSSNRWIDVNWAQLRGRIICCARRLTWLGLRPGDRLAIRARTCLDWLVAELAAARVGATVVGLDVHAPQEDAALILKKSRAHGLLFDEQGRIATTPSELRFALDFNALCEVRAEAELPPPPNFDDPAALIYTSGTTGEPRGMIYTHAQILTAVNAILDAYPSLGPDDVAAAWLPMNHLFQRVMNLVALATGAPISFIENPREIAEQVREVRPTVFIGVPRFYEKLHEGIASRAESAPSLARKLMRAALSAAGRRLSAERNGEKLSWQERLTGRALDWLVLRRMRAAMGGRIRFMITGSAPASREILDFFHAIGLPLMEAYGLSENVVPMAVNRPGDFRPGSVGRPFPQNEIRFGPGGEVLVRGPGVFLGYCAEDGQADDSRLFTADGFYRTGDIGYMDEDGYLYLRGRASELIKTSTGRRVSPVKIETVYASIPEVEHFMVVGHGRKHLAALVTLDPGSTADTELPAVRAAIAEQLRELENSLAAHERIREFAILPGRFSIAGGELTGKLSLRRARICEKYAPIVEQLYSSPGSAKRDSRVLVSAC